MTSVQSGIPATQINDPAGSGGGPITTKISLSSAQILDSNTNPIELIPAPGAGKVIRPIALTLKRNFNGVAYATNINAGIWMVTPFGNQLQGGDINLGFLSSSTGGIQYTGNSPLGENQRLYFQTSGGNPTAGDGTIDIYITYTIIDL